jgi:hypothetical protein
VWQTIFVPLKDQTLGHFVSHLIESLNLVDMNLTLGVGLGLSVLSEEVELHCKVLALRSDLWKSGNSQGIIVVFNISDVVTILTMASPVTIFATVVTSLFNGKRSRISELRAAHSAKIVETDVSVCRTDLQRRGQPTSRIFGSPKTAKVSINVTVHRTINVRPKHTTAVLSALEVSYKPFDSNTMGLLGSMCEFCSLLDSKGYVRSGDARRDRASY